MPRTHPPYPPEFRCQMVELVRSGRAIRELAREFECSDPTIRNWVRQTDLDEGRRDDGLTSEEREFMRANQARYCIATMARMSVSARAGSTRGETVSRRSAGHPMMFLKACIGNILGRKRVARLMREMGLAGISRRKGTPTTRLVQHRTSSSVDSKPMRPTLSGSMAHHLRTELVLEALNTALWRRCPDSIVHHADPGCPYTSYAFGWRRLRQCDGRELFRHLRMRVHRPTHVPSSGRGPHGDLRVHRRVV